MIVWADFKFPPINLYVMPKLGEHKRAPHAIMYNHFKQQKEKAPCGHSGILSRTVC